MLYLEDYLEMIEHLPQELRDRFTDLRELDLTVQNNMDTLDKRVKNFFGQCRRAEIPQSQADGEYVNIRKDYYKVLEDSDEKVQIANQMYDLVDRYLRRLDSELHNFKCELEADNHGITDILEKRSLELDGGPTNGTTQKENRFYSSSVVNQTQNTPSTSTTVIPRYRPKQGKRRNSGTNLAGPLEKRQALTAGLATPTVRPTTPNLNPATPSSQTVPFSDNTPLIVAAAAQAIEKTRQMQQGRRTASLKASYEAIQSGVSVTPHELLMGRGDLTSSSSHTLQAIEREVSSSTSTTATSSNQKRHKKKNSQHVNNNATVTSQQQVSQQQQQASSVALFNHLPAHSNDSDDIQAIVINENGMVVERTPDGEWHYDPNEPRYCICNQVSYGEMVACDNEDCPFEWFHYPCVGITTSPKGKWYCPQCTQTMRRRGNRKN